MIFFYPPNLLRRSGSQYLLGYRPRLSCDFTYLPDPVTGKNAVPIYNQFPETAKNSYYSQKVKEELFPTTRVGKPTPTLAFVDEQNKPVSFASIAKGKKINITTPTGQIWQKSIIITSQLPVAKWYEYINDSMLADGIMDRMTANTQLIELKGDSMRRKKGKANK